jgi:hypothetical protein
MQPDCKALDHFGEPLAQVLSLAVIPENRAPFVARPGQMIPGPDSFDAPGSGHAPICRRANIVE